MSVEPINTIVVASSSQYQDDDDLTEPRACSPLGFTLGVLFPCSIFSCFLLNPREEAVVLEFGKYNGTLKTPGCHYVCSMGRTIMRISTKVKSMMIPETKTIDLNGNPLIINGILSFRIRNSKKAALDVSYVDDFVKTQGLAALKQVVCRYPYEAEDGHCLKKASEIISQEVVTLLQDRVQLAGVEILTFTFNEISYAPEIAAGMLRRQQAQAVLSARKLIVSGAVEIAQGAVHNLEAQGITMDDKSRAKIVGNLLTVICSEAATAPVLPLS